MSYNDANNFPFNRRLFFIYFSISFLEQKKKGPRKVTEAESGKELESNEKDKRKVAERNRFYSRERAARTTATTTTKGRKKKK